MTVRDNSLETEASIGRSSFRKSILLLAGNVI